MIKAGILTELDRVELIFGQIIEMSPVGQVHALTTKKINKNFQRRFIEEDYVIGVQDPVQLVDNSEPEPDVSVAKGPLNRYVNNHPRPEDIYLLIEVSESTLDYDLLTKQQNYATAGVAEYWVIDAFNRQVYQFLEPNQETKKYEVENIFVEGETISSKHLGEWAVKDLLIQY